MAGQAPILPVVPAFVTAGVWHFLWHWWVAITHFLGCGAANRYGLSVKRPNGVVLAHSCRSIFGVLWQSIVKPNARVLTTPWHHSSFKRMMQSTPERQLTVIYPQDAALPEPTHLSATDFDAVVISHMLGRDYEMQWLRKWKAANPELLIIEDRVQAGLISAETDLCDVSLYSAGQDKLPNSLGGGYAVIHNNDAVYEALARGIEALPFEAPTDRLAFLAKKIPTFLAYNVRAVVIALEAVTSAIGISRSDIVDGYRKNST